MQLTVAFDTAALAPEARLDPAAVEAWVEVNHDNFVAAAQGWARQYLGAQGLPAGPPPEEAPARAEEAPPAPEADSGSQVVGPGQ